MEQGKVTDDLKGYWWQCETDPNHTERQFNLIATKPLVEFFYHLAKSGWDQRLLHPACPKCKSGAMSITYDFPRKTDKVARLRLIHAVGLMENMPDYLPMIWEAIPLGQNESWFDFKYVSWSSRGYQSYGLARPAVFSREELTTLFDTYRKIIGRDVFARS